MLLDVGGSYGAEPRAVGERDEDDAQGEEVRSEHEGLDPAKHVHGAEVVLREGIYGSLLHREVVFAVTSPGSSGRGRLREAAGSESEEGDRGLDQGDQREGKEE